MFSRKLIRIRNAAAVFLTTVAAHAAFGATPSFLCSKANSWVEKTICNQDGLSAIDLEVASMYARLHRHSSGAALSALELSQRKWWASRNQCQGDPAPTTCLQSLYTKRIDELKSAPGYPGPVTQVTHNTFEDASIRAGGQGWTRDLSDFAKAITLCVAKSPTTVRHVVWASRERDAQMVALWIENNEGEYFHCRASRDGNRLEQLRAKDATDVVPSQGPLLAFALPQSDGKCSGTEILDVAGKRFGWLMQANCQMR